MNIALYSDLHIEFLETELEIDTLINSFPNEGIDVVVLSGDICGWNQIIDVLGKFCARFKEVVYVPGNHEYYRSSPEVVHQAIADAVSKNPNLHWLDGSMVTIQDQRFIGGTLWYKDFAMRPVYGDMLNDYHKIKGYVPWVFQTNKRIVDFITENLQQDDILVSHHAPALQCVADGIHEGQDRDEEMERFYHTDLTALILERKPAMCLHGHQHRPRQHFVGDTFIINNARGYPGYRLTTNFDANQRVEISSTEEEPCLRTP